MEPRSRSLPNTPLLLSALGGAAIAGYLTLVRWLDMAPAGCEAESGCSLIQGSRFASLFGIPTAAWGLAGYGTLALVALSVRGARLSSRLSLAVSGTGLAVSLYLTAVMIIVLGAVCAWCVASLGAMTVCFGIALAQAQTGAPRAALRRDLGALAAGSLILVAGLHLYYSDSLLLAARSRSAKLQALALHLNASGARFYGASWCRACTDQKEIFGEAASLLPYVECTPRGRRGPEAPLCRAAGIERYPTWIIAGRRHERLLALDALAALSKFEGPGSATSPPPMMEEPAAADLRE